MHVTLYRYGAGGYCSGGTCTSGVCPDGHIYPGSPTNVAITAPGAMVNNLLAGIAATMTGAGAVSIRGGGGGGGSSGGIITQGCSVFIGVVEEAPAGGYGAGRVKEISFNTDGTWTATGDAHTVIFPRI